MLYNAKNEVINIGNASMNYVTFGNGEKNLIMIPGLGEGLRSMKGMAIPFALMYRRFTKNYKVYTFGQRDKMPDRYSTRKMARDIKEAMDVLGIEKADIVGVSMGGMIAQHLAADYPERVEKMVLVVSAARKNQHIQAVISSWIEMAKRNDYRRLMVDNLKKMYTKDYLQKNKWMMKIAGRFGKPKSYDKFIIMANACIHHDAYEKLERIQARTFVIGGELDKTVGAKASRELAERIPGAELKMYPEYGHALYDEAKDFNQIVLEFLQRP